MSIGLLLIILLVIFLAGGFSGRFGGYGYGYGHGGVGVIGVAGANVPFVSSQQRRAKLLNRIPLVIAEGLEYRRSRHYVPKG